MPRNEHLNLSLSCTHGVCLEAFWSRSDALLYVLRDQSLSVDFKQGELFYRNNFFPWVCSYTFHSAILAFLSYFLLSWECGTIGTRNAMDNSHLCVRVNITFVPIFCSSFSIAFYQHFSVPHESWLHYPISSYTEMTLRKFCLPEIYTFTFFIILFTYLHVLIPVDILSNSFSIQCSPVYLWTFIVCHMAPTGHREVASLPFALMLKNSGFQPHPCGIVSDHQRK